MPRASCIRGLRAKACALFLAILSPQVAFGGAWNQPAGEGLFILNQFYFENDAFFDSSGAKQSQARFQKFELNPYVEYGLNDNWTVGANLFVHAIAQEAGASTPAQQNYGLGDSELFIRRPLYRGEQFRLAVQPLLKLPAYYVNDAPLRAGNTRMDGELALLAGYAFHAWGHWHFVDALTAYRHRLHPQLNDQLRSSLTLGLRLNERWSVLPAISYLHATDRPEVTFFTEDGQNDLDLLKLELSLQYELRHGKFLQAGGFHHAYGRDAGAGSGIKLAFGFTF